MRQIMSVSIEPELMELVDEHCHDRRIPRSVFVKSAIREALGATKLIKKKHTSSKEARAMREDGLCNPNPAGGIVCQICYGDENNENRRNN